MLARIFHDWLATAASLTLVDILDIVCVAAVVYQLLLLLKGTRALRVLRGLSVIVLVYFATQWLQLHTLHYLLSQLILPGVIALVIIFQPELRLALERLGRGAGMGMLGVVNGGNVTQTVNEVAEAVDQLSGRRHGALIIFERDVILSEVVETGEAVNSVVSADLLLTIFFPGTALHDGAVVIRNNHITAAGCILPLSQRTDLESWVGTRHRAALGLAEISDALIVVVSEETGAISLALSGNLEEELTVQVLKERLLTLLRSGDATDNRRRGFFDRWWRR